MGHEQLLHRRLVESFVPPPLRLALAADADPMSAPRSADMALLWFDIVDSTRLARNLIESGEAGIEKLASLLQRHFDALLSAVGTHGGQPLMFAGDGLLSGWPCDNWEPREAALRAAQCAEGILSGEAIKGLGSRSLQFHAALAFGSCRTIEIKANGDRIYVTVGEALRDLQIATHIRAPGQLIVSAGALGILSTVAEVSPAAHGCGILLNIRERVPPAPLLLKPLPDSIAQLLAAHVPPQIATRLDPNQMDWSAELRHITVVFAALPDLNCATEAVAAQLEEIVRALMPLVHRHDGSFHQLRVDDVGANLLVLFGTPPVAHADDPVLGVRMAIDLRDKLRGIGYRSTIGVATSHALCSLIGNDTFRKYMAYGDAMNLASRLKGASQGAIQCDEATVRRACGAMIFDPLGHVQVKGCTPIPIWTPRRQERCEPSIPMQGRESELEALLRALSTATPDKQASLVLLEGEAGIGKSRLLAEFRKCINTSDVHILTATADRIERQVPYHGWRDVYAQLLGINGGEGIEARRERVLQALGAERVDQAALLNAVLQLEFPDTPATLSLSAQQRSAARLNLLSSLLGEVANNTSLVVIIDDAHWLDEGSWELAHHVAAEVQGVCLVLSMQPLENESHINVLLTDGALRLKLGELNDADQESLICARLGVQRVAKEVTQLVSNRARGHPFFCIELAQALLEERIIEVIDGRCRMAVSHSTSSLTLPDTVHATVTRRIDRLEAGPKLTLKVASVAGVRFPTSLVRDVYPIAEERNSVGQYLLLNNRTGLLVAELVDETEGYAFRHGIIRDVAYDLILVSRRKQLHLQIAEWYERTYAHNLMRHYAILAHHLEAGGKPDRAARYLALEAQRAFNLGLAAQSVTIARRAAALFGIVLPADPHDIHRNLAYELDRITGLLGERRPAELDVPSEGAQEIEQLLDLLVSIGPLAFQTEQIELFGLIIATAMRLTLEQGNGRKAAEVYSMFSVVVGGLSGNRVEAAAWSRLALTLLGDTRDDRFGRVAFVHTWFHNHWIGSIEDSIALSRMGAEAALSHGDVMFGCFNLAACVIYVAAAGRPLPEVIEVARAHLALIDGRVMNAAFHVKLELQVAKALAGLTQDSFNLSDQEFDDARDIASICDTELSNQTGYYLVSRAKLHAYLGDWRGALEWIARARSLLPFFSGQTAEYELVQFHGLAALAEVAFGSSCNDKTLLEEGRDCIEKLRQWNDLSVPDSSIFGHKADLLAGIMECANTPTEKAPVLLKHAGEAAVREGCLHDAALAFEFLARCHRKAGQYKDASRALEKTIEIYGHWGASAKLALLEDEFLGAAA
jgi:predicted ATPase/class 3 adenylate cyclase